MEFIFTVVNYGIMATLGAGFIFMAVACLVLISRNVRQGRALRRHLATRANSLRMSKMLNILEIDFNEYVHTAQISSINQCMNKCETCEKTAQCDAAMTESSNHLNTMTFCPILKSLTQIESAPGDTVLISDVCLAR